MNHRDQGEIERSKGSQDGVRTGGGPSRRDDDEGSITSGSPKNLLVVAMVAALLTLAGVVFYIAWQLEDLSSASEKGRLAYSILSFTATGISYSGTLVGLGTLATARPNDVSRRPVAVASLLSKAGAAVIILGVAASVCTIAANDWDGWRGKASMVAMDMAYRVFGAGVLAGLALFCLRIAKAAGARDKEPLTDSLGVAAVARGGADAPHPKNRGTLLLAVKQKCETAGNAIDSRFEALYNC